MVLYVSASLVKCNDIQFCTTNSSKMIDKTKTHVCSYQPQCDSGLKRVFSGCIDLSCHPVTKEN